VQHGVAATWRHVARRFCRCNFHSFDLHVLIYY
jgi:hypothetical protein